MGRTATNTSLPRAGSRITDATESLLLEALSELKALREEISEIKTTQQRMTNSSLNKLYSAREIADMISPTVHYQTVLQWIREDKLIPTEGKKISGWELERFLKESTKYHLITGV